MVLYTPGGRETAKPNPMNTQSTRLEKSLECHKHTASSLRMRRKKVYCEAASMDIAHANTISSLAQLAENHFCMDCNHPEVTYGCTTFYTFVCSSCAAMLGQLGFVTKPLVRSTSHLKSFRLGGRYYHKKHGDGTVIRVEAATGVTGQMKKEDADKAEVTIKFDSGAEHTYNHHSHHKLTPRDAFSSNDVIGFLRQGNKAARLFWHANDAGDLEIPDASEPEKVAYAMKLRYVEKRWVKVEGWTKEGTRKVEAPKLHSRLTKARSSAMWSEQEDLYSRAQREEQVRAEADAAFQRFDVDGNGRISVRELKVALRELGFESSAYNTKALMKKFDDGSGGEAIGSGKLENATLELDEFRELVIGLRGGMKLM